jgi:lipoprotein-releasing system ATP-binding protein
MTVLEAIDLAKTFVGGDGGLITVLDGVNLRVARGEMVAVVGASGAGKSTLLHLIGALEKPTRGSIMIAGEQVHGLETYDPPAENGRRAGVTFQIPRRFREVIARKRARGLADARLSALRNRRVGFVFQFHHLLREFTALENVMMPLRIAGWDPRRSRARAEELLARVGLTARAHHRPAQMSGGEQQRAAVARALALDPAILLADEPSGNLDHANSERLHDLFAELSRDLETAMVVVTHNRSLAARADRVLLLEDGRLADAAMREVVT